MVAAVRGQHASTSLFREVQAHLSSVIIRFLTHSFCVKADQLQAPATEDDPPLSPEHCPMMSSREHSLKKLMLHKW